MQEALHSFNVKFRFRQFECQLTIRDDEQGTGKIVTQAQAAVVMLSGLAGVTPTNGNGHAAAPQLAGMPAAKPAAPVCPHCGQGDQLELVPFKRKDGTPHQAYKCQRCGKWLPDKK